MKRKVLKCVIVDILIVSLLTACGGQGEDKSQDIIDNSVKAEENGQSVHSDVELVSFEDAFTKRDLEQVADLDTAIYVNLSDEGTTIDGRGAEADGNVVTFTDEGIYVLSGSLSRGQLVVDAAKEDKIQLVLQGVSITNDSSAALYIKQADKVFVTTGAGTDNSLQTNGVFVAVDENNVDGAVFSKEDIVFNGEGSLNISCSSEHGVVSKDDIKITGGTITVDADGDGFQANDGIYIADGTIRVLNSYEGLEAQNISIWNGNLTVIAEDDGLNGAGGNDGSGLQSFGGGNPFEADLSCNVAIYDGKITISADGDGLDSNGNLIISGGEIYVNGPTNGGNGAIDYGGSGIISGGVLVATGADSMAENMGQESTQCSMMVTLSKQMLEGEIVVTDEEGNVILTHTPDKNFNNAVISHSDFEIGKTYTVSVGENTVEVTFDATVYGQGRMNGGGFDGSKGGGHREPYPEGERPEMSQIPEGMELPERPGMKEGIERPEIPETMEGPEPPQN